MKNLIRIEADCFDIANRLREIDRSYEVYFNLNSRCYEVHSRDQVKSTYCFRVPFKNLDERTIYFAIKTLSKNKDNLIKEIEESNLRLEKENLKKQVDALKEIVCL